MARSISRNDSIKKKRPRIAPGVRAEVERGLRAGISYRELAAHYGIADGSVRAIAKKVLAPADVPAPDVAPSEPATDQPPVQAASVAASVAAGDTSPQAGLAQVEAMITDLLALSSQAKEDRNYTAAQRAARDAADLMPLRDRLRKACEAGAGDTVAIPRAEIDKQIAAIYERARTLASVELCPHCGRELRMAAVGAAKETE